MKTVWAVLAQHATLPEGLNSSDAKNSSVSISLPEGPISLPAPPDWKPVKDTIADLTPLLTQLSVPPDTARAPKLLVAVATNALPAEFHIWNVVPLVIAE